MAIAEDVSTPIVAKSVGGWTTSTIVSGSFTPPSNCLIVALLGIGYSAAWTTAPSVTVTGGSLTWTQLTWSTDTTNKFNAAGLFYASVGTSPGSMTVTATRSGALGASGGQLAVRVLTGAASPPIQQAAVIHTTAGTANSTSISPSAIGSQIYCQSVFGNTETMTPTADTTTVSIFSDTTDSECVTFGTGTALTTSTSSTSYGWTGSSSATNLIQVFEVEAAVPTSVLQRATSSFTSSSTTTNTVTLPSASTIGATQILMVGTSSGSSTVTATGWTLRSTDTTNNCNCFIYDRAVTTTAQTSATVTYAAGGSSMSLVEVAGLTGFDKAATADLTSGSSTTQTTGSITTVAATSYLISLVAYDTATNITSFSAPITLVDQGDVTGISSTFHAGYGDGLVSTTAAYSTTETSTAAAAGIETHIAAWKGVAAGGGALTGAKFDVILNRARYRASLW